MPSGRQQRPAADFSAQPLAQTAFLHNLGVNMVIVGLTLCAFPAHLRQRTGVRMKRFAQAGACALLLAGTALQAGCGNSSAGLATSSTSVLPPDAPAAISNDDPMARPVAVAWTSARAKRCGFYFDPAKLRTSYLAYEARQASGEQYTKIEKTYDTTYKATSEKVSQDVDYCSDRKALEIKADLERHLAADYTPNLPKPKTVASCGLLGCAQGPDENFTSKKFWSDMAKQPGASGR